tara:strand:+ start:439 stop:588 length:150 start_codon:yes stop_codon:yes gene_type:complete
MFLVKSMSTWVSLAAKLSKDHAEAADSSDKKNARAKTPHAASDKTPSKH